MISVRVPLRPKSNPAPIPGEAWSAVHYICIYMYRSSKMGLPKILQDQTHLGSDTCVYIYIFKCLYIYIFKCLHIYIYVFKCLYIYIHTHTYADMQYILNTVSNP